MDHTTTLANEAAIRHRKPDRGLKLRVTLIVLVLAGFALLEPVLAQQATNLPTAVETGAGGIDFGAATISQQSLQALMMLLVLAILVESGLAVVFEWDVYRAFFAKGALKPVIAVVVSFVVVRTFKLDVIAELVGSYTSDNVGSTVITQFLTALIIAGGSHTVNRVRKSLGLKEASEDDAAPPATNGWLSVRIVRGKAITGPVRVTVTEVENPPDSEAIAGMALARRPGLASLFFRNNDRFPASGGYPLDPEKSYKVAVVGQTAHGKTVRQQVTDGPIRLAAGAIVDFDVRLVAPQ